MRWLATTSKYLNNMKNIATMYLQDLWGYRRTEIQDFSWSFVEHAQYANAIRLQYVERGKRKPQVIIVTGAPGLVILDGWDHPDPPPTFAPIKETKAAAKVMGTRRLACDPEWNCEFWAFLKGYLAGSGAKLLLDSKEHPIKQK